MDQIQTIKTNLTPMLINLNGIISFSSDEQNYINFKIPTIGELTNNINQQLIMGILFAEEDSYSKINLQDVVTTKGQFIYSLSIRETEYSQILQDFWKQYIINFSVEKDNMFSGETLISPFDIEYISDVILVGCGYKNYDTLIKDQKEKEERLKEEKSLSSLEKKMLKKQQKAMDKLKKAKQKKQEKEDGSFTQEQVLISVCYEHNLTLEDIKKINYYTLYWYFSYSMKIDYHKVIQIAAGNGNLNKNDRYKYWI